MGVPSPLVLQCLNEGRTQEEGAEPLTGTGSPILGLEEVVV